MSFKQLRMVCVAIDCSWSKEASLEDNVESLLHKATVSIQGKLGLCSELDLMWRAVGWNRFVDHPKMEVGVPRGGMRRSTKNLNLKLVCNFPKSVDVQHLIVEYNSHEVLRGCIPGSNLVQCMASSGACNSTVLPTRCYRPKSCPSSHILCYRCVFGLLKSLGEEVKKIPLCIVPGCLTKYFYNDLLWIVKERPELTDKIERLEHSESFAIYNSFYRRFECPWCHETPFPQVYVEKYNITVCRSCDKCSCDSCLSPVDLPENQWCNFKKGQQLLKAQERKEEDPEQYQQMMEKYSFEGLQEIKEAYEYQDRAVYQNQCCPACFTRVFKTHGCDHMICWCGQDFCWRCGAPMDPKVPFLHFEDNGDCKPFDLSLF
ncbi:uncharacterized protein LOC127750676 [Frankliniella occidentalis]|uniref:Uncharacterized protein LOC127750676 n=1 Tax=Frankliniella occidentalis TaxID=133901 RepID=A0A9C6X497_FRAOC|nr:uncharacterized protein LOC127750676 [Frankliniella occidentalis]